MALIYVTGAPGAGKTTIKNELVARGFEAHDMDDSGIGGAYNVLSGEKVTIPPAKTRSKDWFDMHEWRTSKTAIERLEQQAQLRQVFLCGVAPDDTELLPIFDKVIYLDVDEATLRARISARQDNDYGKNESELNSILERSRGLDSKYKAKGVVTVDGSRSLKQVVDDIVIASNLVV